MISDIVISWVRTAVPVAVAAAVTWLAVHFDIVLDQDTSAGATTVAVAVVTAVYYAVVRKLEQFWPTFGLLLGAAKQPAYARPLPTRQDETL